MLSTTWARKYPPVTLNSNAAEMGTRRKGLQYLSSESSSLRHSLNSSQKTPDTSASVQAGLKHTLKSLSSTSPQGSSRYVSLFPPTPHFKPTPSQKQQEFSVHPAVPKRTFSYRPTLRARACWIPLISFCVCSIFSIVWKRRTLRAFLVLLLAW